MNGSTSAPNNSGHSSRPSMASMASGGNKAQLKASNPTKGIDGARKQAASPVDGTSSKKSIPPKAWTSGTNPITQRSTQNTVTNGLSNGHVKAAGQQGGRGTLSESSSAERHAHDRLLFLLANFTGQEVTLTVKSGDQFSGVFYGFRETSNGHQYILKMTKRTKAADAQHINGASDAVDGYVGDGEDHTTAFDVQDTVDLFVFKLDLVGSTGRATNGSSFRTDTEISGNLNTKERELQRWEPGPDSEVDMSLGGDALGSSGAWDQFAANERLYNVRSDYDEDLYTTTINRSDPKYKQREREAERLAREMEREGESKRLGQDADAGLDEEDKYSGVRRDTPVLGKGGPNAYVPPSKRAITTKPSVTGAPFDPAIISSQLARPSAENERRSEAEDAAVHPKEKVEDKPTAPEPAEKSSALSEKETKTVPASADSADRTSTAVPPQVSVSAGPSGLPNDYAKVVYNKFKEFSNTEKLRVQETQRSNARREKSVKLNDLKKFSQNFKLESRVPEDLVPILAKTKEKQDEIRVKAELQAREKEQREKEKTVVSPTPASRPVPEPTDSKTSHEVPGRAEPTSESPSNNKPKPSQNAKSQTSQAQFPRAPGMLAQRVAQNQAQHPVRTSTNVPPPLPIQTSQIHPAVSTESDSTVTSPTSAMAKRFNVKAMEFRPNPSASNFTPVGPASPGSSSPGPRGSISTSNVTMTPRDFFSSEDKAKPLVERPSLAGAFNPIKRMLEEKSTAFPNNGGIPQAYRTGPTWDVPEGNQEKTYTDMFQKPVINPSMSPMSSQLNGAMPHQHQLPLHLQNGSPAMSIHQNPRFYPSQSQQGPLAHMEDQRMQFSSSTSSVQPSPRMAHPSMAWNGQMHPQMPGLPYGMPANGMSPNMHMRPMPGSNQYMGSQGGPMGGQMMVQQASNGPYMNGPGPQQMPMYSSPVPGHAQPHFSGHAMQHASPGGYTGSPRGHPMSHQGSQQGQTPQPMYMMPGPNGPMMMPQHPGQMTPMRNFAQPHFAGQHPQHSYGMQHRQMSSGGYNHQMTPRQQHAMPQQGPGAGGMPPAQNSTGDEGK